MRTLTVSVKKKEYNLSSPHAFGSYWEFYSLETHSKVVVVGDLTWVKARAKAAVSLGCCPDTLSWVLVAHRDKEGEFTAIDLTGGEDDG